MHKQSPAQLKSVTVLLSIPAFISQTDNVENTSSNGKPDEKPRKKIFKQFVFKNIEIIFFQLISPK